MLNRMLVNYDDSNISGRGALKLVYVANDRTIVLFMMFLYSHLCWPSFVLMQACLIPWFRIFKKVWHLQLHQIDDGCNDCWGHLQTFWLSRSKQLCPRPLTRKPVPALQCIWLGGEAARSQFGDGCVPELSGWLRIYDSHHTSVMLDLHVGIIYSTWLGVTWECQNGFGTLWKQTWQYFPRYCHSCSNSWINHHPPGGTFCGFTSLSNP